MVEKKLSKQPYIHENCQMFNTELGEYTEVGAHNYFENVKLGDYSYTGQFCILQNVEVGKFSNIAAMVRIGPTAHPMERPTLHHITYRRKMYGVDKKDDEKFLAWRTEQKTYIGHDTWIGHGAIIMPGVKVGNGAVVGSGAIVTKNVDPYSIVIGIPAKHLRYRFDDQTIKRLEEIRWWDWSYETIKNRIEDLSSNIETFLDKYGGSR
ncbi:DapH/DapD/GlmU-related protein [Bacillus alveayuensis]|jgi:phosphonate metabolism protein (transferase hexapeptide repeat family)|uniref:Phosphonate metabolism protein (Transferase hexapeptide repeat family) n=1 Tax=Aeribacillus alveayuensis TaxID=279215 RepID=A0ABT9VSP0_9BACI|nr:DapH/DapD/GlmU-related protein [Bacillus alveayuensis]MDQ0163635.1 phosphonate metabolism protein (transferase hexapeptide repeat family) [Bacillus alveayuensis]